MTKDYGNKSYQAWELILKSYKSKFGGGKIFCQHHWGKHPALPSGIKATVHYDNGVVTTRRCEYSRVNMCGKCGRVRGEQDGWM